MSLARSCLARPLSHAFQLTTRTSVLPPTFLLPFRSSQVRYASAPKPKKDKGRKKKRKGSNMYAVADLKKVTQFPLLDAMRYLRAVEVGRGGASPKYEVSVALRTLKNSAVIRNRVRLPHPVKTDVRIAVICPPDSPEATACLEAGAVMVGEDPIFEIIRQQDKELPFDRLLCHPDSLPKLNKAGLARTLGPKGMMPSAKTNTVMKELAPAVGDIASASEYRERNGVVSMAVGQLGYTPDQLQDNLKAFLAALKKDTALLSERVVKEIHEVVLSTTHGPGISLNGSLSGPNSLAAEELTVI